MLAFYLPQLITAFSTDRQNDDSRGRDFRRLLVTLPRLLLGGSPPTTYHIRGLRATDLSHHLLVGDVKCLL